MKKIFLFILLFAVSLNVKAYNSSFPINNFEYNISSESDIIFLNDYITDLYLNNDSVDFNYVFYYYGRYYLCNNLESFVNNSDINLWKKCSTSSPVSYFQYDFNSLILPTISSLKTSVDFQLLSGNDYIGFIVWSDGSLVYDSRYNDTISDNITTSNWVNLFKNYGSDYLFKDGEKVESLFYRHLGYNLPSENIVDDVPPIITLNGSSIIDIEINTIFSDPGYVCIDNIDTECNVSVVSNVDITKLGEYSITYSAIDSFGNSTSIERKINIVDTNKPDITLFGDDLIYYSLNDIYDEFGAFSVDNSNEVIEVVIDSSALDMSQVGSYNISYSACDSSNNCSTIYRLIKVQSIIPVDFTGSQFLLFDFSDIQDTFPKINFSGISNSDQFVITIIFNIFFILFILLIVYLLLKIINKMISIIF